MSSMSLEPGGSRSALDAASAASSSDETAITQAARARTRRRRFLIWGARAATLVIVIGGWQLFTSWKIVDPFFYGQPSGIAKQLSDWVQHGTQYGSLWQQIWVTMKEALLGFVYGVVGGVVLGVLLGQFENEARVVTSIVRCDNTRTDSPRNRYNIDPGDLVRIQREGRERNEDIVGFYHSHPDHPPHWSETDLADAEAAASEFAMRAWT